VGSTFKDASSGEAGRFQNSAPRFDVKTNTAFLKSTFTLPCRGRKVSRGPSLPDHASTNPAKAKTGLVEGWM